MSGPLRLHGSLKRYPWGSPTDIPHFLGEAPDGTPQAELWFGDHPAGPADVDVNGHLVSLVEVIRSDPLGVLGADVVERCGARLPFLVKLLAADQPLSLQVHPSKAQAEAGFDREERLGVTLESPERCYRDRNHKPELIHALGPFEALCGFRPVEESAEMLETLGGGLLGAWAKALRRGPVLGVVADLLTLPPPERQLLVETIAARASSLVSAWPDEARWTAVLAERYPDDAGVVVSLLLQYLRLERGETLSLEAGNLHSYLRGFGLEVMASSDNVLRGGLTRKHVDISELLSVVDPTVGPKRHGFGAITITNDEDFSVWFGRRGDVVDLPPARPSICVVLDGSAAYGQAGLGKGEAALGTASMAPTTLRVDGRVAVVTVAQRS